MIRWLRNLALFVIVLPVMVIVAIYLFVTRDRCEFDEA